MFISQAIAPYSLNIGDEVKVMELLDKIIDSLKPNKTVPAKHVEISKSALTIPSFPELTQVKQQLSVHMKRLSTREEVLSVTREVEVMDDIEAALFGDREIGKFREMYAAASVPFLWFKGAKRELREQLAQQPVIEEVEQLYVMLKFAMDYFRIGEIMTTARASAEQTKEGELYMEIARIFVERLAAIAVRVECKLDVGDLKIAELGTAINVLTAFREGQKNPLDFIAKVQAREETELKIEREISQALLADPSSRV